MFLVSIWSWSSNPKPKFLRLLPKIFLMKLSSTSLVGALAAIVVGTIAAPVPHSLKQLNLFERDDGELVVGLFTRDPAPPTRQQTYDAYIQFGNGHHAIAGKHLAASVAHSNAARLTGDKWHIGQANYHTEWAGYHNTQCTLHYNVAPKAWTERTEEEKNLIRPRVDVARTMERSDENADRGQSYAMAIIEHHHGRGDHPGPFESYRHTPQEGAGH